MKQLDKIMSYINTDCYICEIDMQSTGYYYSLKNTDVIEFKCPKCGLVQVKHFEEEEDL